MLPKGLYARALLIVIAPMVLLQSVLTYVFLDRHWQSVTRRLSAAVSANIGALVDVYETYPQDKEGAMLARIAQDRLSLDVDLFPNTVLPPRTRRAWPSLLEQTLQEELGRQVQHPFWIGTDTPAGQVEVQVQLNDGVMRITARRSLAYASNWHIFFVWMLGSSLVLIGVATVILRNQIRPILALSDAADALGKGRDPDFRPRGALEVRKAGYAFLSMKRRIERSVEQRTTMLAGISHDLRTILTRFRLSLALMPASDDVRDLTRDVDAMQVMIEGYLNFARDDTLDEATQNMALDALLTACVYDAQRLDVSIVLSPTPALSIAVRPSAFRRMLDNVLHNAARHAQNVVVEAQADARFLTILIDDDGEGVPENQREEVFKPFVRLDDARNQDETGTGLGLAIARDIARSHGGDITLGLSRLGGLRVILRVPI
jgi:two-component system, OmpR family, osmolarity sensor histidine kinase EnvZ